MKVIKTDIPEVIIMEPDIFGDHRGFFMESFNRKEFDKIVPGVEFVQDNDNQYRYFSNDIELIYNLLKEKWQIWKKEAGFIYTWVAEQKEPNSLFFENSFWLFNPRYSDIGVYNFRRLK